MQPLNIIALLAIGAIAAPSAPLQARDEFLVSRNCYNWIKRNEQHSNRACELSEDGPGQSYRVKRNCYNWIKRNEQHTDVC
ncbi:hypothetical protein J3459_017415 [Metarhizium acridum]|uniref:Uncharacterized protein n=1 Tax=Metarhizium acridum (strain CQMa 102) TaxID=655827 RepID=E9E737_METAQ|nr:uncharacterized protein MAC_05685 [Metarhizium acridum CQMa 102]EFY88212.1 hypothetical protein MAC_05685 [Metarhizium acridum CQMa 102]KAG8409589.1 hypothetical protein J3459_017415 [Metarhizium acridum]